MLNARRRSTVFFALALAVSATTLIAGPARRAAAAPNDIHAYVSERLDDFSATMHITFHDDNALRKISKDFGMIYKLQGDIEVRYKEENRLRLDARLGASKAAMINNGTKQYVRMPSVNLRTTSDLGSSPGKRKTLLDVGLVSAGYLAYTEAEFKGMRPVKGVECALFRISYRDKAQDTSHRLVWIDPRTKIVVKREEYSQEGKLNATFYYEGAHEVIKGVWFPSRIMVENNQGQRAGETAYQDIHVNANIPDSVFN